MRPGLQPQHLAVVRALAAIADAAVDALLAWRASGAAIDAHLADQLVRLVAFAEGGSRYTCPEVTPHLRTVAWVVHQFLPVEIALADDRPARVEVGSAAFARCFVTSRRAARGGSGRDAGEREPSVMTVAYLAAVEVTKRAAYRRGAPV